MKKALAILLTFAMLFAVLAINTTAATTPSVTVFGNESRPVKSGEELNFTVRLSDFGEVQGLDLIITANNNVTFTKVSGDFVNDTQDAKNYKLQNQKIHIVDVTKNITENDKFQVANIVVTATVNGDSDIQVTGKLAKDGTTLFQNGEYAINNGVVVVKDVRSGSGTSLTPTEGYFTPYGAVYYQDESGYKYATKTGKDAFNLDGSTTYNYTEYKLPDSDKNITTFESTETINEVSKNAIMFNNYAQVTSGKTYGTMLIKDWDALQEYYVTQKGETNESLLRRIYDIYADNTGWKVYSYNGGKATFEVCKVAQNNYMWKSDVDGGILEYAVRIRPDESLLGEYEFSAVAYSNDRTISTVIQTKTYTFK